MVDGSCWKERAMSFLLVVLTYVTSSYLFLSQKFSLSQ